MDYLFASVALARRLISCEALSPLEWQEFSDHAPIVATFDLG
jgi:exonuclease III